MATTPITELGLIAALQEGADEAINEAVQHAEALGQLRLASITTAAEPAVPADGLAYFVPAGATGATWAGQDGQIAMAMNGGWTFFAPVDGMRATVLDEDNRLAVWSASGSAWNSAGGVAVFSPAGIRWGLEVAEEVVTLAGASTDSSAAFLPNGAHVMGVRSEVVTAITGATGYDCGRVGATQDYGSGLGIAAGSAYHGMSQGLTVYADTAVRITAVGADFTGGQVRLTALLLRVA